MMVIALGLKDHKSVGKIIWNYNVNLLCHRDEHTGLRDHGLSRSLGFGSKSTLNSLGNDQTVNHL